MKPANNECLSKHDETTIAKKKGEYTQWTPEQDAVLIEAMLELTESREVEGGKFKLAGFHKLEAMIRKKMPEFTLKAVPHIQSRHRYFKTKYAGICEVQSGSCSMFGWDESKKRVVADDEVFNEWIKSHPDCKGLNKKPFMYFDQLSRIFGKDRAMGSEAQTAAYGKEPPVFCGFDQDVEPFINLDDETSQHILENMINEGVDHMTLLNNEAHIDKTKPATSTGGNKRVRHEKSETIITSVRDEIDKLQPMMEQTAVAVDRIANSFCMEDDLIANRRSLFEEISKVEGLTRKQAIKAAMVLVKDVPLTDLYYQLPTADDRLTFLLQLID